MEKKRKNTDMPYEQAMTELEAVVNLLLKMVILPRRIY